MKSYTKTEVDTKLSTKADKDDTYTKTEVDNKLDGYIKNDDRTYTATFRGKGVVVSGGTVGVSGGTGYGSSYYKYNSIQKTEPMKPTCDYFFPEKSGTFAMTSDIPTVNDPTITFTQGGVTKGSFSLNQATDHTIELDAGGSGGGGGSEYLHSIKLTVVDLGNLTFSIKNNDSKPFTKQSLNMWLGENGYIGNIFYSTY